MESEDDTPWERLQQMFQCATRRVEIVAPFIKVDALRSLLSSIPQEAKFNCVTRWRPNEVAAGVSDTEVIELIHARGNATLSIVDRLHAKIYVADDQCLAGSANVTQAGLGRSTNSNIEVLVQASLDDPTIAGTLAAIREEAIQATPELAQTVERLAAHYPRRSPSSASQEQSWHPVSRTPGDAYRVYTSPPADPQAITDRRLLSDIASANLGPGLSEDSFREAIRARLADSPLSASILSKSGSRLTRNEASNFLERLATEDYDATDLWTAFVAWMDHFYGDQVIREEVNEVVLRRGRLLYPRGG